MILSRTPVLNGPGLLHSRGYDSYAPPPVGNVTTPCCSLTSRYFRRPEWSVGLSHCPTRPDALGAPVIGVGVDAPFPGVAFSNPTSIAHIPIRLAPRPAPPQLAPPSSPSPRSSSSSSCSASSSSSSSSCLISSSSSSFPASSSSSSSSSVSSPVPSPWAQCPSPPIPVILQHKN